MNFYRNIELRDILRFVSSKKNTLMYICRDTYMDTTKMFGLPYKWNINSLFCANAIFRYLFVISHSFTNKSIPRSKYDE